ncbi:DUF308 domain-containing protein [Oerskovia jenensis]|uniref:Uncharacterized membrane protein HdeD (DUF308 family) n=1 Tax=Oerskovia jenensis TaxID=162169 RepID=A0ABS2LGM4_9CELL|nr:DUF308 domain-containing protein [Oerskovia jenensis]MBM7479578.1 uncharacterized membrane protein HdeD (DUF308 family) [Oerskovia jenensis]
MDVRAQGLGARRERWWLMVRSRRRERAAVGVAEPPHAFKNVWWLPVVRGVLLVVLGLLLMIQPLEALETLRWVFGIFLVADAVLVAAQGLAHRKQVGWRWWLAQAVVDVLFGVAISFWPDLSATALYYVLVVWVLVLGVVAVVGAAGLVRNRDLGWPWMLTSGIVSALFGLLLVTRPVDAGDVLSLTVVVFGLYAFVAGAIHVVSGFGVRSVARELADLRAQAVAAGVVVTGGSVLGAGPSAPVVAEATAAPAPVPGEVQPSGPTAELAPGREVPGEVAGPGDGLVIEDGAAVSGGPVAGAGTGAGTEAGTERAVDARADDPVSADGPEPADDPDGVTWPREPGSGAGQGTPPR